MITKFLKGTKLVLVLFIAVIILPTAIAFGIQHFPVIASLLLFIVISYWAGCLFDAFNVG